MLIALALFAAVPIVQNETAPEPPKKEQRTCRSVGSTGSRMSGGRVCKTVSEWARIDAANNSFGVDANHTGIVERNRKN